MCSIITETHHRSLLFTVATKAGSMYLNDKDKSQRNTVTKPFLISEIWLPLFHFFTAYLSFILCPFILVTRRHRISFWNYLPILIQSYKNIHKEQWKGQEFLQRSFNKIYSIMLLVKIGEVWLQTWPYSLDSKADTKTWKACLSYMVLQYWTYNTYM